MDCFKKQRVLILVLLLFITYHSIKAQNLNEPKVLVVLSSKNTLHLKNGKTYPTGYYFNELAIPAKALTEAGYKLVFADPLGNVPSMDKDSDSPKYFHNDTTSYNNYHHFLDTLQGLKQPMSLQQVIRGGLNKYSGIFIPGGHAPLEDLCESPQLAQILFYFHKHQKPTAMICHGPIALLSTLPDPSDYLDALTNNEIGRAKALADNWIYGGYEMTIFSTAEEKIAEKNKLGGKVRFYPDAALQYAGGKVETAQPWQSQVIKDRELITGQNPNSDEQLAKMLVNALKAQQTR